MNSIEVLKEALDLEVSLNRNHGFKSGNNTELEDAYKKAILALEQKEKRERLESDALCSITNEDLDEMNKEEQELKKQGALEELRKIIHKIDEIVNKDIWDFGIRIEEIEDEVDKQSNGKKPQMTNKQIDEIDKLKGRVLEARKIKNYLESVRIKELEMEVKK